MKTLLISGRGDAPDEVLKIVRDGSTEVREMDELRADAAAEADRVVIWRGNELEVRGPGDREGAAANRLRWPQDEDKLRLFFQTAG